MRFGPLICSLVSLISICIYIHFYAVLVVGFAMNTSLIMAVEIKAQGHLINKTSLEWKQVMRFDLFRAAHQR